MDRFLLMVDGGRRPQALGVPGFRHTALASTQVPGRLLGRRLRQSRASGDLGGAGHARVLHARAFRPAEPSREPMATIAQLWPRVAEDGVALGLVASEVGVAAGAFESAVLSAEGARGSAPLGHASVEATDAAAGD